MAGINDYPMYYDNQFLQQQLNEKERSFNNFGDRYRHRPSDLRLPATVTPAQQFQALQDVNNYQDDIAIKRYVGIGVGWTSLIAEHLLSHPFVVLRRQCQVHNTSVRYHLIPITLLPVIIRLHQRQGVATLWKGIGSVLIIRGVALAIEDLITKFTPWPKKITASSSLRSFGQHIVLKCISFAIITPFYSASLVETVQSDIASESPGVFGVFKEGACRFLSWANPAYGRMLPVWALVVPTVAFGVFKYLFGLLVEGSTSRLLQVSLRRQQTRRGALPKDLLSQTVHPEIELTASMVKDLVADIVFYPFETVLHRLHLQGTRTIIDDLDTGYEVTPILTCYQGVKDCLDTVMVEEGMSGLYKGFGALILQYAAQFAIIKMTKFLITEVTILLRSSRSRSNPPPAGRTPTGTPQTLMPPSVQIKRQHPSEVTPLSLTPDQVRYFYPE